ncbi:MAG: hypothetical protein WC905_03770 [Patescibacteria group bacterium]|jgi:hypothetical protein
MKQHEVVYKFKTTSGVVNVTPDDIIAALKEQSEQSDYENYIHEEDLQGWSIINATDEEGKSRPLFLIRTLPNQNYPPYSKFHFDDENMRALIYKNIYRLTPVKIFWIRLKLKMRNYLKKLLNRGKKHI